LTLRRTVQRELETTLCAELTELLAEHGSVVIDDIGTFSVRKRRGYEGRNPEDGAWVVVPPTTLVLFKVAQAFKAFLQDTVSEPPHARCDALVARVTKRSGLAAEKVARALETWWQDFAERARRVEESLDFELEGLGVLHVEHKPGEELSFGGGAKKVPIADRRLVTFKPSKRLLSRLDGA
jgi:nucleoid DNA-binding protein